MGRALSYNSAVVLLALVALAGITACTRSEVPQKEEALQRMPISFNCFPVHVSTKADAAHYVGGETLPVATDFAVYAWNTGDGFLTDDPGTPDFMNPLVVEFNNNNNKGKNNTYTGDYYWPISNTPAYAYSFLAYYPYNEDPSDTGITVKSFDSIPSGKVAQFEFRAKDDVEDMVDFCVSDIANDVIYGSTYSPYSSTVGLTFHHALTRVQIRFVKSRDVDEDTHIYIEEAKLLNVRKEGVLTVSYAQFMNEEVEPAVAAPDYGRPGTTTLSWTTDPDIKGNYEITINGVNPQQDTDPLDEIDDAVSVDLNYTQTIAVSDVFLMLPQRIWKEGEPDLYPSPQTIQFHWKVGGDDQPMADLLLDECVKAIGSHENAGITEWTQNMSVVYTIVIKAKPIQFEVLATIRPWDDVDGYYPIIP